MSLKTLTTVWERSEANGTALLCMLALADFADDNGEAFPKISTLARRCRVSERTILRVLEQLIESGELAKVKMRMRRGGQRNHYQILCLPNVTVCQVARTPADTSVTMQGDTSVTMQGDTCVTSIMLTTKNNNHQNTHHSFSSGSPGAKNEKKVCESVTEFSEEYLTPQMHEWSQQECPDVSVSDSTAAFLVYHRENATQFSSSAHLIRLWRGWMQNAQRFANQRRQYGTKCNFDTLTAELSRAGIY